MVPWLRCCAPSGGSLGLIPSQGTRSHRLQEPVQLKTDKTAEATAGKGHSDCKCQVCGDDLRVSAWVKLPSADLNNSPRPWGTRSCHGEGDSYQQWQKLNVESACLATQANSSSIETFILRLAAGHYLLEK